MLPHLLFLGFFLAGVNDLLRPFGLHGVPLEQIWQIIFVPYVSFIVRRFSRINIVIGIVMLGNVIIALFSGALNSNIGIFSLQTFYIFLMPIVTFSAGSVLRAHHGVGFERSLYPAFRWLFVALFMQGIIYVLLYMQGNIGRVGSSIPLLVPLIYLIAYSSRKYLFMVPLAVVFSGKRIVIVLIAILGLIAMLRSRKGSLKYLLIPCLAVSIAFVGLIDFFLPYFERWNLGVLVDATTLDFDVLDRFSSGRIDQWISGLKVIDTPFKFIFGSGSGTVITYLNGEVNWYVHNAFITYFVQSGLIGIVLIIYMLIRIFKNNRNVYGATFSYYYFIYCIITIPFSANVVINPLFWFFSGVLYRSIQEAKHLRIHIDNPVNA
jgi:hypothetical protein